MANPHVDGMRAFLEGSLIGGNTKKSLSEIHDDKDACKKIFKYLIEDEEMEAIEHDKRIWLTTLAGSKGARVFIYENSITYKEEDITPNDQDEFPEDIFELVDLIRSLGYEPKR